MSVTRIYIYIYIYMDIHWLEGVLALQSLSSHLGGFPLAGPGALWVTLWSHLSDQWPTGTPWTDGLRPVVVTFPPRGLLQPLLLLPE